MPFPLNLNATKTTMPAIKPENQSGVNSHPSSSPKSDLSGLTENLRFCGRSADKVLYLDHFSTNSRAKKYQIYVKELLSFIVMDASRLHPADIAKFDKDIAKYKYGFIKHLDDLLPIDQ